MRESKSEERVGVIVFVYVCVCERNPLSVGVVF